MKKIIKEYVPYALLLVGGVLIIYVSGWLMFFSPIYSCIKAFRMDVLSANLLFISGIKVLFSGTIACLILVLDSILIKTVDYFIS